MKKNKYTGFTPDTVENLILDTGVFFRNYNVATDTFDSAVIEGKLLGATKGGGEFNAKPQIRALDIDGLNANTKGAKIIDDYEVNITANVMEVTEDIIKLALAASEVDNSSNEDYTIIKGKMEIKLEDYIENITWVGTLSGSRTPVIIQVFNALNQDGLAFKPEKKGEAVIALNFIGHYDPNTLDEPPFSIYYPKKKISETKGNK
ncbi:MAG: hypothetical protein RR620_13265 [Clostridium sp.]